MFPVNFIFAQTDWSFSLKKGDIQYINSSDFVHLENAENNRNKVQIFINSRAISNEYEHIYAITPYRRFDVEHGLYEYIVSMDVNVGYVGISNGMHYICIDDRVISTRKVELPDIQILPNGAIYYKDRSYGATKILKNNDELVLEINGLISFLVNNNETNIVYTRDLTENGQSITNLYINNDLIDSTLGLFARLTFSSNGKQVYYVEAFNYNGTFRYFIRGPNTPESTTPFYRIEQPIFSANDENGNNHILLFAYSDWSDVTEGVYIIIDKTVFGPYYETKAFFLNALCVSIQTKTKRNDPTLYVDIVRNWNSFDWTIQN
jgi:hypothetical protein